MGTTTPELYRMVIEPRVLCMVGTLSDVLYPSPTSPQFIFSPYFKTTIAFKLIVVEIVNLIVYNITYQ